MKTLILCVATGKYLDYAEALAASLVAHAGKQNPNFIVFADRVDNCCGRITGRTATRTLDSFCEVPQVWSHLPWPMSTMLRYHAYLTSVKNWGAYDLILAMDADLQVVQPLDFAAMAGRTVGTLHPGFTGRHLKPGTYEDRPASACYVPQDRRRAYFAGGLVGGSPEGFRALCEGVVQRIDADLKAGIIPRWHDESALNAYFAEHPPDCVLDPTYLTPEGTDWYGDTSDAKILALQKPKSMHDALRT